MRSKKKIDVKVQRLGVGQAGKLWVKVYWKGKLVLVPSFEDLFRIVLAIVHCEKVKYAERVGDPAEMVKRFFYRCVEVADHSTFPLSDAEYEEIWESVAKEFDMPARTRGDG